jgi:hypothetical protein
LSHHPAHQQATQQTQRYYRGNQNFLQHFLLPSNLKLSMNTILKIYHPQVQLEQFTANPRQSRQQFSLNDKIAALGDI